MKNMILFLLHVKLNSKVISINEVRFQGVVIWKKENILSYF